MKQLIAFTAILFLYGCSKSSEGGSTSSSVNKTTLLTSKEWILTIQQSKKVSETTWTDTYSQLDNCSKDDRLVFKVSGVYEANEGSTKCNLSDPFIYQTGTWRFAQNESILIITETGSTVTQDATIETLDANSLIITYVERVLGTEYITRQGYKH
ncbi:MAG: hypothetical protein Q8K64_13315 [Sediminibacterium sp.]|nr:hypothetical protein [Sediminibacterium sp.]